jgi:tripeptide aminopeptidase
MSKTSDIFKTIVQIGSPSGHEGKMATFLGAWLDKNGFTHRRDTVGNLYAFRSGAGSPLLLCTHMDTVEPGIGIQPVENGGVIKSSGDTVLGADNKAAVAAVMTAVEKSKGRSLELLFTVKEETGGGIEHFPADWIKAKKGLTFDSANPLGGIVLRSPFIANFKIAVTAGGARINAGEALMPLSLLLPPSRNPLGELDNGETTVNIGKSSVEPASIRSGTIEIQGEVRAMKRIL